MSNQSAADKYRLPTYRHSHLGRYHPYVRVTRPNARAQQARESSGSALGSLGMHLPPAPRLCPTTSRAGQSLPDDDISSIELDPPEQEEGNSQIDANRRKVVDILADMIVRRLTIRSDERDGQPGARAAKAE